METVTINESQCGVWLSNSRGHYIGRDAIELATGWGFIIDGFAQWALVTYDDRNSYSDYPDEALNDLCDEAVAWLNSGQDQCQYCDGGYVDKSKWANVDYIPNHVWIDQEDKWRCKYCTGTGRAPRIEGQNFPPIIPQEYQWAFEDGDFGLFRYDDDGLVI